MAINTIEYAKVFQQALDEQVAAEATSGWMEDNAAQLRYSGGNEIKLPKMSMTGLGNYDRDDGFVQGSVSLSYETLSMSQDRGMSFQIDAMDVDESNFAASATNVMVQFQRTRVIPEVDAYRYSRIYQAALAGGRVSAAYTPDADTILAALKADIAAVQDAVGDSQELVISMSVPCANVLEQADRVFRQLSEAELVKGRVTTKVMAIDNIPIVRVGSKLMKTAYVFNDGRTAGQTDGGITPAADAKQINWIVALRRAPIAVSKTDTVRIFDPMTNQKANAWKLDYRKYHDLWIPENQTEGIMVGVGA